MKYFHELTKEEYDTLIASGISVGEAMEKYKQPDWCEYPDALGGAMGCWSLVGGTIKNQGHCKNCDLNKDYEKERQKENRPQADVAGKSS